MKLTFFYPQFGVLPKTGDREKLITKQKNWFGKEIDSSKSNSKESKESAEAKKAAARAAKTSGKNAKNAPPAIPQQPSLASFKQSDKNLVPLFVEKCVKFIELEGLDSEGIYRVPGNRTHVDLLYQKFEEGKELTETKVITNANAYFVSTQRSTWTSRSWTFR